MQASLQLGQDQKLRVLEHRGNYLGVLASLAQEQQEVEQQLQVRAQDLCPLKHIRDTLIS